MVDIAIKDFSAELVAQHPLKLNANTWKFKMTTLKIIRSSYEQMFY